MPKVLTFIKKVIDKLNFYTKRSMISKPNFNALNQKALNTPMCSFISRELIAKKYQKSLMKQFLCEINKSTKNSNNIRKHNYITITLYSVHMYMRVYNRMGRPHTAFKIYPNLLLITSTNEHQHQQ